MSLFKSPKQQPQIVRAVSYPQRRHAVPPRYSQPQPRSKRRPAFLLIVGLLVVTGLMLGLNGRSDGTVKGVNSEQPLVTPKSEVVTKLDFTIMDSAINGAIQNYSYMDVGVAVIDIKTGDSKNYGVQNPFVAASTAKLLTAIAFLHDVEAGKASLSDHVGSRSADDALKALIVDSDNDAWNDFNNGVMSHAELSAYAASIGLASYNPDTNTIPPQSFASLLSNLYQNKLLTKEHTKLLLSFMQQATEVKFITDTVPAGIKVYHKPGYLADRVHDAAVVDNGKRPYVLVIFSKSHSSGYDMAAGAELFKQITLATTSTFTTISPH